MSSGRASAALIDRSTRRLAGVIVIGAFLSTLEASIVAVGLDTIAADLGVGLDDIAWVSNIYLLALAVSLPLCGWLGRRMGVGRLWLLALAGFTATSVLCAAGWSLPLLLIARVLQGLSAGLLVPAGQTLLGQAVGPERLGRVMGVLGLAVSAGPALVSVGLPATLYALTSIAEGAWTGIVVLVIGIAALSGFVVRSLRTATPLTELRLLRGRVFAAACTASALFGAVMFSSLLVLPLWFQLREGAGAVETGLSLVGFGLGTAVAAPLAGQPSGPRRLRRRAPRHGPGGGGPGGGGGAKCALQVLTEIKNRGVVDAYIVVCDAR